MWETLLGKSIRRHFLTHESEDVLALRCRRCNQTLPFAVLTPLVYILGETIHHLQDRHNLHGDFQAWHRYLDDLPAPENPA